jgi:hypothetical protein
MFKSLELIKYIKETDTILWNIIDDNFEELIEINPVKRAHSEWILHSETIFVYERRKLNVPSNLVLFFKFIAKDWYQSVEEQIKNNLFYNKNYLKYHNEVEKYLLLL